MIGISRKSMISKMQNSPVDDRLEGTISLNAIAALNGVNILRVHDVKACRKASIIVDAYKKVE